MAAKYYFYLMILLVLGCSKNNESLNKEVFFNQNGAWVYERAYKISDKCEEIINNGSELYSFENYTPSNKWIVKLRGQHDEFCEFKDGNLPGTKCRVRPAPGINNAEFIFSGNKIYAKAYVPLGTLIQEFVIDPTSKKLEVTKFECENCDHIKFKNMPVKSIFDDEKAKGIKQVRRFCSGSIE
jgi:hypothetical protein